MKLLQKWAVVVVGTLVFASAAAAQQSSAPRRTKRWDPELVRAFETIPIQEEGRVKPLATFAYYKLLQLNGKGSVAVVIDGKDVSLGASEWLLDCLFFPEQARSYPCFLLQTWDVADAMQLKYEREGEHAKHKRDRWTFDELLPGFGKLGELQDAIANDPDKREASDLTPTEAQIDQLSRKVVAFEKLLTQCEFGRHEYDAPDDPKLAGLLGGATSVRFCDLLEKLPELVAQRRAAPAAEPTAGASKRSLDDLLVDGRDVSSLSVGLALFPPADGDAKDDAWLTIRDVYEQRSRAADPSATECFLPAIAALEEAARARDDVAAMKAPLQRFHDEVVGLTKSRCDYGRVVSEVSFHKADLLYDANVLYVLAFVAVAIGWTLRPGHWWHRALPWGVAAVLAVHVAAIVWRCWLRSRPPITNLYETIPFIGAVGVTAALVIEFLNRRRIGVAVATVMGAATLFLAHRFEAKEAFDHGSDTMPQLVAVLDTNFWLATHVTTINIGYAAALLAGLIAHVYVVGRALGLRRDDADFYRSVARTTYGAICFGLLFSVVGTILGGVWANDSWGRFWGWDVKENGALMICLCELAILHARMGGYVQQLGLCNAAVLGNAVVIFSWFHVNQLGVGLHSYGRAEGMLFWIWTSYAVEFLVFLAGLYVWLDERARRRKSAAPTLAPAKGG